MTREDARENDILLVVPNVSIGNPENSKEWIPFFKGMTKRVRNDRGSRGKTREDIEMMRECRMTEGENAEHR